MRRVTMRVAGMTCRHCVRDVTSRMRDVPGVHTVTADGRTAEVVVQGVMSDAALVAALSGSSYLVEILATNEELRRDRLRLPPGQAG